MRNHTTAMILVYWLNWHSWPGASVAMVDCKNASALLADPWVVTLDELNLGPPPADGGVHDAKPPVLLVLLVLLVLWRRSAFWLGGRS